MNNEEKKPRIIDSICEYCSIPAKDCYHFNDEVRAAKEAEENSNVPEAPAEVANEGEAPVQVEETKTEEVNSEPEVVEPEVAKDPAPEVPEGYVPPTVEENNERINA